MIATSFVHTDQHLHNKNLPSSYHLFSWLPFPKKRSTLYPMSRSEETLWMSMCLISIASNCKKKAISPTRLWPSKCSQRRINNELLGMPEDTYQYANMDAFRPFTKPRPSVYRWIRITKSFSLNHRLIGIDAMTSRCKTTNQVAIITLHH